MEYGAIDLHKKESQVRIVTERGEVLDRRIATTRDRFTAVFEGRRPMRIRWRRPRRASGSRSTLRPSATR